MSALGRFDKTRGVQVEHGVGSDVLEGVECRGVASARDIGRARWHVVMCSARACCPGCLDCGGIRSGYSDVYDGGRVDLRGPSR
jgi:hypothetical protein